MTRAHRRQLGAGACKRRRNGERKERYDEWGSAALFLRPQLLPIRPRMRANPGRMGDLVTEGLGFNSVCSTAAAEAIDSEPVPPPSHCCPAPDPNSRRAAQMHPKWCPEGCVKWRVGSATEAFCAICPRRHAELSHSGWTAAVRVVRVAASIGIRSQRSGAAKGRWEEAPGAPAPLRACCMQMGRGGASHEVEGVAGGEEGLQRRVTEGTSPVIEGAAC